MTRHTFTRQCLALLLVILVAVPAAAQQQLVLIHGFKSSGDQWHDTAQRLRDVFDAVVTAPNAPWDRQYFDQAQQLESANILTTPTPVLLGHSNGGHVARNWARLRTPDAIVTIGTPHQGAPLMPNFWNWYVFADTGIMLINDVGEALSGHRTGVNDLFWLLAELRGSLNWLGNFSALSVGYLIASFGLDKAYDVVQDMRPGSPAVNFINGLYIENEIARVPSRVGIVSTASNFYFAGPARAFAPHYADAIAATMYVVAAVFAGWATNVMMSADIGDTDAMRVAGRLYSVADHIVTIDAMYCTMVSSVIGRHCEPNDGVVPISSQEYPRAANVRIEGPAHIQEMDAKDVITDVLRQYTHLPRRSVSEPTTPGPEIPGPETPGPEGPTTTPGPSDVLPPDATLTEGSTLRSADGRFTLVYQSDSNLVLYDETGGPMWSAGITTSPPGTVVMQADGNLVMYDEGGYAVWATNTGVANARLVVQNDGNLVIYAPNDVPVWSTGTHR